MTTDKKPLFSAGCIVIGLCIAGFLAAGLGLLAVAFYRTEFLRARQGVPTINETPVIGAPAGQSTAPAEKPSPTPAQTAALANGTEVAWSRYGLTWTVPPGWSIVTNDDSSFTVKSTGASDAGWLNVSVSPLPASFPYEQSLAAMYRQALGEQTAGRYIEVRLLEIDGIRGVEFCEGPPANASDVRRLEWQGYRPTPDGVQLLSVMTHASGEAFASRTDELHAILYSTRLSN